MIEERTKDFCVRHNITEDQFYGKVKIEGSLDLSSLTSIPKGFNPTVGGGLYLSSLTSIPKGFNPTVGGGLYLSSLTSIPKEFNPTVGGNLYLDSLTSIPKGFNPTVGGGLYLSSLTSIPKGFNPTVGGSLYLDSLTSIPKGFNPTVGGSLDLSSLTSIPKGFNPTVGGSLDLSSLTSIPKGFNPTVGGGLYLKPGLSCEVRKPTSVLSWNNGKHLLIDGVLTEINSKYANYYKGKIVGNTKSCFIATNGVAWAHGETLKAAVKDLLFKGEKKAVEQYKGMKVTAKMEFAEAVACYRSVTGACSLGVKNFVETLGLDTSKKYSVKDMIKLSEGKYGGTAFKEFFA